MLVKGCIGWMDCICSCPLAAGRVEVKVPGTGKSLRVGS